MNEQLMKDIARLATEVMPGLEVSILEDTLTGAQVPLPQGVQNFCASIDKNFDATIRQLIDTAEAMKREADGLLKRAAELRDAGPDLSKQVKEWIAYERESHAKQKFFATLFTTDQR